MNAKQLIKVMIVDDEILAIEHLKSLLIWEDYGFTITAEAVTAIQAIKLAKEINPQVIFMDIRMPLMDGLEISKNILSHNRQVKIVLFTSHRDFEYAKEAIRIGVSNYLIKHEMNSLHLKEEMVQIRNELAIMEQNEQSVIRQSLRELLEGKPITHALQELERRVDETKDSFILLFVQADTPFPVIEMDFAMFHSNMPDGELWRTQPILEQLDYVDTLTLEKGKQAMLFVAKHTSNSENLMWSQMHKAASILQKAARRNGLTVSVIISSVFKRLGDLYEIYHMTKEKSASIVLAGKGKIWNTKDIELPDIDNQEEWQNELKWLRNANQLQEEAAVIKYVAMTFEWVKLNRLQPNLVKLICRELVHFLEQWRTKKGMPSYTELSLGSEIDYNSWHSAEGIKQWFIAEVKRISAYSNPRAAYSQKVQLTMQYIEEHYQEDLTIDSIGKALFMSGDHLRHIFKEETDRTVIDFLTHYRIERSKELLASHQYKIYEISKMVGYNTSQYFSNVFKKWSGVTPQEYIEAEVNCR